MPISLYMEYFKSVMLQSHLGGLSVHLSEKWLATRKWMIIEQTWSNLGLSNSDTSNTYMWYLEPCSVQSGYHGY